MNKSYQRVGKLINLLTGSVFFLFVVFAIVGYLSLGDLMTPNLFTLRRKIGNFSLYLDKNSTDLAMRLCQIGFGIACLLQIAIALFPAREQIYIFYKLNRSTKNHMILSVVLIVIAFIVPCFYPDITSILGLVGGIMFGTAGYAIPLVLKIVSMKDYPFSAEKGFNILMLIGVVGVQIMSVYVSIFVPENSK